MMGGTPRDRAGERAPEREENVNRAGKGEPRKLFLEVGVCEGFIRQAQGRAAK